MNADIARSWILANAIAQAVGAITALIGSGIRSALEIGSDDVSLASQAFYVGAEIALSVFYLALFARLTAAVLGAILPGFPYLTWKALHMMLGAGLGISLGLSSLSPSSDDESFNWDDGGELAFVLVAFVVGGGLIGAALGSLQGYVLRPVADGLRSWVMCSAAAVALIAVTSLAVLAVFPSLQGWVVELALSAAMFVSGLIGAVIMLPAVHRLRPRFR